MKSSRKTATVGLLAALCFGLSYLEFLLPFSVLGVPGIKVGLANICVLAALYLFDLPEAAGVNIVRIILSWLIFGSFTGLLYSLAGAVLSLGVMLILKKTDKFSPVGISAAGGAMHNVAQIAVAAALTDASALWYYLPILLIAGTAAGTFNGIILKIVLNRVTPASYRKESK